MGTEARRNPNERTVAVLGVDSPIGLTLVRELGERGLRVLALGRSDTAIGRFSRHAAAFERIERPLAKWLPGVLAKHGAEALLAVSEHDLIELAGLGPNIGGCRLLVPDAGPLGLVLDKARTFEIAAGLGIDVPASWQPVAGEDFAARAAELAWPVAVKWPDPNAVAARLGAAGLALEKVEYAADAGALLAILRRYDALGEWPLVQTWCAGHGLGQMLHMDRGKATLRFQHRRLREFPPSGGVSAFCAAVPPGDHAAQMAKSEALLAAMGWQGAAMVEYRHDPVTGRYWLMEVNGRFWGSLPLAYHCGAHFGWETWARAMEPERVSAPQLRSRRARYLIPDSRALVMRLRDRSTPVVPRLWAAARFALDFLDPRVRWFVWSWRDPGPFVADLRAILAKVGRSGRAGRAR